MLKRILKKNASLHETLVVTPSFHRRYSGVTSTLIALLPRQIKTLPIALCGSIDMAEVPQLSLWKVICQGWSKPPEKSTRIWHARRNNDMIIGLALKKILRQPWQIVFTSAAQRKKAWLTRWLLRQMDAVIATSEASATYLQVPSTIIPHGVDTQRFHPENNRAEAWKKTGLPGTFGIGAFGRIRPNKGTDLFVHAMIKLLPKYPEATAVITGIIVDKYQPFVDTLKKQIADADLENRILFLGQQSNEEIPLWFRRISLYVAPMRWEGFGLTPLEAMASGTAVVATRTGAAPQLVEPNKTGILVQPDDLKALTTAIETLLKDPQKIEDMGHQGREKALNSHNIDMEATAIQAVYERLWTPP